MTSDRAGHRVDGAPPESNRRPHPYDGTTGNRCADRRFPWSRSTVRPKVWVLAWRRYAFTSGPAPRCPRHRTTSGELVGYGLALICGLLTSGNSDIDFLSLNGADSGLHLVSAAAGVAIALWPAGRTVPRHWGHASSRSIPSGLVGRLLASRVEPVVHAQGRETPRRAKRTRHQMEHRRV
jgi:hypothetical protein